MDLYHSNPGLWGTINEREKGTQGLIRVYKDRLGALFGERFMKERSAPLVNSRNTQLFEFIFLCWKP